MLATMTGIVGALLAALWSFLMASKVAAPRAKRLIVTALTSEGPELQAVRDHLIQPALDAQYAAFTGQTASGGTQIASEVENAVNEALEAFRDEIGPQVANHVTMAINQVKAQETKSLQAQLEELGVPALVEEGKAVLAEQMPPQLLQAQRILGMKVSKRYAAEHPIEAQAIEMGKLYLMQMMQGQLGLGGAAQSVAADGGGFGVRGRI